MRNRAVGRPPSGARTASDCSHPSSARQVSALYDPGLCIARQPY